MNGDPEPPAFLKRAAGSADLVIAADGGALRALDAGITPDLIVGDMDSLGEERARELEERGAELERHPPKKDKMDGHLAVLAATQRGATEVDFLCATGGKLSAVFAIPHLLLAAERKGLRATLVGGWGQAFVVRDGSRKVEGSPGDSVSIFPLDGTASGVDLEGFIYPLKDARIEPGDTLGFHNELSGHTAQVEVRDGAILVVHEEGVE